MSKHETENPAFYLTIPAPCPYLDGKQERKVFTHLIGKRAYELNDILTQGGFRRSQNIAYRPACEGCQACISVRILAQEFKASRSLNRVWKRNCDLIGSVQPNEATSEQYSLFRRYLDARHFDGGMSDMVMLDYAMMVEDSHVTTQIIEYRKRGVDSNITGKGEGELIAVSICDVLSDGLSMVYSFFNPALHKRSLGTWIILDHIQRTQKAGLDHVYLGYWVANSPRMSYKSRFKPQEILTATGWNKIS